MIYDGHEVVVSVDPGFGGTGICMYVSGKLYRFHNIKFKKEGTERYVEIASRTAKTIMWWLSDLRAAARIPDEMYVKAFHLVIESPHAMGGVKGRASLGSGDVFKVAKLAGAIGAVGMLYAQSYLDEQSLQFDVVHEPAKMALYYPEVRAWKGQISKATTKRRVLRDVVYDDVYTPNRKYKLTTAFPEHIFDAAGLGMWFLQKLKEHKHENFKEIN